MVSQVAPVDAVTVTFVPGVVVPIKLGVASPAVPLSPGVIIERGSLSVDTSMCFVVMFPALSSVVTVRVKFSSSGRLANSQLQWFVSSVTSVHSCPVEALTVTVVPGVLVPSIIGLGVVFIIMIVMNLRMIAKDPKKQPWYEKKSGVIVVKE